MQFPDMSQYLNSMMEYWGPMMDVATQRAQALPEREAIGFDQFVRDQRLQRQLQEEELKDRQYGRKRAKSADKTARFAGDRSMGRTGGATRSDPRNMIGGSGMSKMMQTKETLDAMPRISTGGIGGTESWRNMPAASAMTGLELPRSGMDVYADIAQAGRLPSRR